jgi:hypothetical protein
MLAITIGCIFKELHKFSLPFSLDLIIKEQEGTSHQAALVIGGINFINTGTGYGQYAHSKGISAQPTELRLWLVGLVVVVVVVVTEGTGHRAHENDKAAAAWRVRPAARSEGPGGELLAPVRPLGPVRSWVGLGVVRGPGGPTWPLGRWVRWPVTPTGTGAGSSAPPPYRRLPAGGRGRACSRLIGRCRSSKYMPRHGL